ncbi:MAG: hypothetical protein QG656_549 [Candidatus Hydrogenedentes bacterium]|nr:hypothetical protein [Candidatus Hydrogenedentota bacterium]
MPAKYHIDTKPAPPRHRTVGKLGIVDWREDCSNCRNCVKRDCVYGFYREEADTMREHRDTVDYVFQCKGCLSCVQNCTKAVLTRVTNPEYLRLGDEYFTPDIVSSTWYQAETGNIPVSGSGYGGPFSGPGFDSMWTDMSEIVRPTRDGIHGREYISTSVDIGRKVHHLMLGADNQAAVQPPLIEIPLPIIFDILPPRYRKEAVIQSVALAAARIGGMFIAGGDLPSGVSFDDGHGVPLLETDGEVPSTVPMVEVPYSGNVLELQSRIKAKHPNRLVAIRLDATPDAARQVCELTKGGAEVVHLVLDAHGREYGASNPRHSRDVLRDVHRALVKEGIRDSVTLIASGGIALAEHVAKAIICGADLVSIDLPLMVALECRLCGECTHGEECPINMAATDVNVGAQRIVNLMGAWRNQLLEMLGAMGIREVRRLRGETGRCMFFEDLEAASFGRLFGKRKVGVQAV